MKISIIIPSFNTCDLTLKCVKSIIQQVMDFDYEIIVVDNHSTDNTVKEIQKVYLNKNINGNLIVNNKNLGFAKAVNQGINASRGDYFLIVNSDVLFTRGCLNKLLNGFKNHPDYGISVPKLLNSDQSPQASIYYLPSILGAIKEYWFKQKGSYEKYLPQTEANIVVQAAVGAVMMIKKETVQKIGQFDEKYFMYFEDLDYCRKANRAGIKIVYCPKALFIHHHGASGKNYQLSVNQWLINSAKIYHGLPSYYFITWIIKISRLFAY